tara:strand:- start:215 stop:700 length:486 start_codon:yes stop_codon:yes gene_type:complete
MNGDSVMMTGNWSDKTLNYFKDLMRDPEEIKLFMALAQKQLPHRGDSCTWHVLLQNHGSFLFIRDANQCEIIQLGEEEVRLLTVYARSQERLLEEPKSTQHVHTVAERKKFLREILPFYEKTSEKNRFSAALKARLAFNKTKRPSNTLQNVITLKKTNLNH